MQKWRHRIVISPKCRRLFPTKREALLDLGCQRFPPFPHWICRWVCDCRGTCTMHWRSWAWRAITRPTRSTNITVFTSLLNTTIIITLTMPNFSDLQQTLSLFWGISESVVFLILFFFLECQNEIPLSIPVTLRVSRRWTCSRSFPLWRPCWDLLDRWLLVNGYRLMDFLDFT